ncbi:univin-like [Dendronephthya gigantea]|uniref:univin-like n=1 Tax=Dendronephthya gigantea TaxID=151771 RepID=UPI00106A5DE9|nr:univin-like [Dendronephthya gigantea]
MNIASLFLLIFAFCEKACEGTPVRRKAFLQQFPTFMQDLYQRYMAGRNPFSSIVHSNAAIAVKSSDIAFEATFDHLGFLQHENLKRARLRLNISQQNHCSMPVLNVRVLGHKSGQVFGNYVMSPQSSGVNTLNLTNSIRKLATGTNPNEKLKVRITLRNPSTRKGLCSNVLTNLVRETYLVTNTDEPNTRKRRATEGISKLFPRDAVAVRRADDVSKFHGRSKRRAPTCKLHQVTVNLTGMNNSVFILPTSFKTGICGLQQPVPLGSDPMMRQLAQAVATAIQSVAPSQNSRCCRPSKFRKLTVLYFDSMQHTVLRHVDNVKVKKCACANRS